MVVCLVRFFQVSHFYAAKVIHRALFRTAGTDSFPVPTYKAGEK